MSDNIPLEIQTEILKRVPIKSLIRSRSVSKPWKSLIDSSEFIAEFNLYQSKPHHLLVSYDNNNNEEKYVSIIDDNTFPEHKYPLTLPVSSNINQLRNPIIIGSSQGLFCFYSYDTNDVPTTKTAVIWNPAISKTVTISVPNVLPSPYATVIVFGVCPKTNHPKLVKFVYKKKVTYMYPFKHREFVPITIPPRVEICSSKSREWRTISNNVPRESIALTLEHVAIDKFVYWLGYDRKYVGDNTMHCNNLILLFDIPNEEFTEEINLPDSLQGDCDFNMGISKLRDSLVVLVTDINVEYQSYDVWIMENGVSKLFRKLYTIKAPDATIKYVLGFRKSGEPIIDKRSHFNEDGLFVYNSVTEQFNYIWISGNGRSYFSSSYVESLLLLDH